MIVAFIDPGPTQSGFCVVEGKEISVLQAGVVENYALLTILAVEKYDVLGIEMPVCYGGMGGGDIYHTCRWVGRFEQCSSAHVSLVSRPDVLGHVAGKRNAKKGMAWECMKERFGEPGTKSAPGKLYGIKDHARDAFEGAVYIMDTQCKSS